MSEASPPSQKATLITTKSDYAAKRRALIRQAQQLLPSLKYLRLILSPAEANAAGIEALIILPMPVFALDNMNAKAYYTQQDQLSEAGTILRTALNSYIHADDMSSIDNNLLYQSPIEILRQLDMAFAKLEPKEVAYLKSKLQQTEATIMQSSVKTLIEESINIEDILRLSGMPMDPATRYDSLRNNCELLIEISGHSISGGHIGFSTRLQQEILKYDRQFPEPESKTIETFITFFKAYIRRTIPADNNAPRSESGFELLAGSAKTHLTPAPAAGAAGAGGKSSGGGGGRSTGGQKYFVPTELSKAERESLRLGPHAAPNGASSQHCSKHGHGSHATKDCTQLNQLKANATTNSGTEVPLSGRSATLNAGTVAANVSSSAAAISDSGANDIFLSPADAEKHGIGEVTRNQRNVSTASASGHGTSTGTVQIRPFGPDGPSCTGHVMGHDWTQSLVGVNAMTQKHQMTVVYKGDNCYIFDKNGDLVKTSTASAASSNLYPFDLNYTPIPISPMSPLIREFSKVLASASISVAMSASAGVFVPSTTMYNPEECSYSILERSESSAAGTEHAYRLTGNYSLMYGLTANNKEEQVDWLQRSSGYQSRSALHDGLAMYPDWPGNLTQADITKYWRHHEQYEKGHMTSTGTGYQSTKQKRNYIEAASPPQHHITDPPFNGTTAMYVIPVPLGNAFAFDGTADLPVVSKRGHTHMVIFVMGEVIHAIPVKGKTGVVLAEAVNVFRVLCEHHGHALQLGIADNQRSLALDNMLNNNNITSHYVPVALHWTNPAERGIGYFKPIFKSIFAGADPNFDAADWDLLIPQINLLMNIFRKSKFSEPGKVPISVWHAFHGRRFDPRQTPLVPIAIKCQALNPANTRASWGECSSAAYTIGTQLDAHRGIYVLTMEGKMRMSNRIAPTQQVYQVPGTSKEELIVALLQDVKTVLNEAPGTQEAVKSRLPSVASFLEDRSIYSPEGAGTSVESIMRTESNQPAIMVVATDKPAETNAENERVATPATHEATPALANERVVDTPSPPSAPVPSAASAPAAASKEVNQPSKVVTWIELQEQGGAKQREGTRSNKQLLPQKDYSKEQLMKFKARELLQFVSELSGLGYAVATNGNMTKALTISEIIRWIQASRPRREGASNASQPPMPEPLLLPILSKDGTTISPMGEVKIKVIPLPQIDRELRANPKKSSKLTASSAVKVDIVPSKALETDEFCDMLTANGDPIKGSKIIIDKDSLGGDTTIPKGRQAQNRHKFGPLWRWADAEEMKRQTTVNPMHTRPPLERINENDIPKGRTASIAVFARRYKPIDNNAAGAEQLEVRTRVTYDGSQHKELEAYGAYGVWAADQETNQIFINNVVSGDMEMEVVDITQFYPSHELQPGSEEYIFINGNDSPSGKREYYRVNVALPGLIKAGKIAHEAVTNLLAEHGYVLTPINGLYKHVNGVFITCATDNFRISAPKGQLHLIEEFKNVLRLRYSITTESETAPFLGVIYTRDRANDCCYMEQPTASSDLLNRFGLTTVPLRVTPMQPVSTNYASKVAQTPSPIDESPPLDAGRAKTVQEMLGCINWMTCNTRPDLRFAHAKISQDLACPTELTWTRLMWLCGYIRYKPIMRCCINKSEMILKGACDASHNTEKGRRSRSGFLFVLSNRNTSPLNCPIMFVSSVQSIIALSAMESEYVCTFDFTKSGMYLRKVLSIFGHVQDATPAFMDNNVVKSLLEGNAKPKRTKHMDLRFYYARDLFMRKHFVAVSIPGARNPANYLTKAVDRVECESFNVFAAGAHEVTPTSA